jgi:hypothetical protein
VVWEDDVICGKGPICNFVLPGEGPTFHNTGSWTYAMASGVCLVVHGSNDFGNSEFAAVCE